VECYLCNSKVFKKRPGNVRDNCSLSIFECKNCGLVRLSSFDHISDNFYSESKMHGDIPPPLEEWRKETNWDDQRRFESLVNLIENKKILDFGCGAAGFLMKASSISSSVSGVEKESRVRREIASNLKIFSSLDEIKNTKFDVITSFHVLEHLKDPVKNLIELSSLLKSNGHLIVEVPNSDDALLTFYESPNFQKFYWSQHLFLFNESTLGTVAKKAGLKVKSINQYQRYPLSNHLHWLAKGLPGGHEIWSFIDSKELSKMYGQALGKMGRCDTIIAHLSL